MTTTKANTPLSRIAGSAPHISAEPQRDHLHDLDRVAVVALGKDNVVWAASLAGPTALTSGPEPRAAQ